MATMRLASRTWRHPLERGIPPAWASAWGYDRRHGPYCAFVIDEVVQRLRWIPPGTFWMGSPEDDKEGTEWERPRHLVTIHEGFWIFEAPCTQALWRAVMGENPSRFKQKRPADEAKWPVETVRWGECQEFLAKLNARLDGLRLSLPSEAQWEYACRAGTATPRYLDDLDAIAWYDKNSKGTTHAVAGKEANAWGLYDMLGNVWEWCADDWTDDYTETSRAAASAGPVIRGGSWNYDAQYARAAHRSTNVPTLGSDIIGFRCAEFREGS